MAECSGPRLSSGPTSAGKLTTKARTAPCVLEFNRRRLETVGLISDSTLTYHGQCAEITTGTHLRRRHCTAT